MSRRRLTNKEFWRRYWSSKIMDTAVREKLAEKALRDAVVWFESVTGTTSKLTDQKYERRLYSIKKFLSEVH